MHLFIKLSLFV